MVYTATNKRNKIREYILTSMSSITNLKQSNINLYGKTIQILQQLGLKIIFEINPLNQISPCSNSC